MHYISIEGSSASSSWGRNIQALQIPHIRFARSMIDVDDQHTYCITTATKAEPYLKAWTIPCKTTASACNISHSNPGAKLPEGLDGFNDLLRFLAPASARLRHRAASPISSV